MKSKTNAFILGILLVLAFGALGCGSVSSDGGTVLGAGAAGGGGTGGTGGAGGMGGMGGSGTGGSGTGGSGVGGSGMGGAGGAPGESNCPDDVLEAYNQPHPILGFDKSPGAAEKATITYVYADSMGLALGAGGPFLVFSFRGSDLSAHFTIGEVVDISMHDHGFGYWSVVANATTMAAAASMGGWHKKSVYETPGGGPAIVFEPQCAINILGECSNTVLQITLYQVIATHGQETVTVSYGQSGAVGAFQVTHLVAYQFPTDEPNCDGGFSAAVTVLGPSAP